MGSKASDQRYNTLSYIEQYYFILYWEREHPGSNKERVFAVAIFDLAVAEEIGR